MILAGKVKAGNAIADKPGRMVAEDTLLEVLQDPNPYASRGGLKLEHALQVFNVSPKGKTALDVGASTGGFTDCLLQAGAQKVYAVDVGYGQLDWKLQKDPRVVVVDRTNARHLTLQDVGGEPLHLAVIDVAFISLKLVVPPVISVLKADADLIALVKPQFEVGKDEVENKGIIKDPEKHLKVLLELNAFIKTLDWTVSGLASSPIFGQKGNREFLIHCVHGQKGESVTEDAIRDLALNPDDKDQ